MLVPAENIANAEDILTKHLATYGPAGAEGGGLKLIGGENWWKVRGRELEGEWIEVSHGLVHLSYSYADECADAEGLLEAESKAGRGCCLLSGGHGLGIRLGTFASQRSFAQTPLAKTAWYAWEREGQCRSGSVRGPCHFVHTR